MFGSIDRAYILDHNAGWDVDLIGGYDFGMIRAEAELGYKHASIHQAEVSNTITLNQTGFGSHFDADGHSSAWSVMVNALLDFGDERQLERLCGPGYRLRRE